jgi:hydrogenase large subunit
VPDTLAIAGFYKDWFARGEGLGNFLTVGDFPAGDGKPGFFIPAGVILNRDLKNIQPIDLRDPQQVQEFVAHSWYDYAGGKQQGLHPHAGETKLATTAAPSRPTSSWT